MTQYKISMPRIDLSGPWQFFLGDPSTADQPNFNQSINLPGSLQQQGFGNDVTLDTPWTMAPMGNHPWFTEDKYAPYTRPGNIKIPFWLQPEKHYIGAAWYRRDIEIPVDWVGKRVTLFLERAHIETRVWLDGREAGSNNSLATPHIYELGMNLEPGFHRLDIRVDNRLVVDVGVNSHSVTDHTQTNWNGIIGRIELAAGNPIWIENVQVYPNLTLKSARLKVTIGNATGNSGRGNVSVGGITKEVVWDKTGGMAELEVPLGEDSHHWDEFSPTLQQLEVQLGEDTKRVTFGLREVGVKRTQITVNGSPVFLRGTLECCVFPKTGYPPMDLAEWTRIFSIIKDYGFNHVRFHSWCPPEAAFVAADELGLYLQVECSSWANMSVVLGEGEPVDAWLYEEAHRILRAYGNHPSFLLMAYGNEPGKAREKYTDYLTRWVAYWKEQDKRRLYTSAAGWPAIPGHDFHNIPETRMHTIGEGLNSRINRLPPATTADYSGFVDKAQFPETLRQIREKETWNSAVLDAPSPIISHEIGQWCAYPDFSEIPKYTGLLKAKNFEIFQETLEAAHMGDQASDFLAASGRLQILCYKEEIESTLRTKNFAGFQVLQANDFPGQGTALVGWLNPFWESKGYTSPAEFRRFNNPTVLLARLERRVFSSRDVLHAEIGIAHFGELPLEAAQATWRLIDDAGQVHASGDFPALTLPIGNGIVLGEIEICLAPLPAPRRYKLISGLAGTDFENDWDVWVYPPAPACEIASDVVLVHDWEELLRQARGGRKILFNPRPSEIRNHVPLCFSSIFWSTAYTGNHPPHTLGLLCDPEHPLFANFPTNFHSDWQWWELLHGAYALPLDGLPPELRPVVQVIDDWFTNRRLGLVFEVSFNDCDILVCGGDITNDLPRRHAARQFRHCLITYMESAAFHPPWLRNFEPAILRRAFDGIVDGIGV